MRNFMTNFQFFPSQKFIFPSPTLGAVKRAYSSANSSIASPPEKKPNIEDMKEYSEAQRLRKEIVAQEADEDIDYYAEDFQNADDDDDDDNNAENTSGSVVIKSDSGGPVNHAKIISEVLKKYPHLVKNNKNIKLKILQKGNSPVTVSAITKGTKDTHLFHFFKIAFFESFFQEIFSNCFFKSFFELFS